MLRQRINLGFHIITNPRAAIQNHARKFRQGQRQQLQQKNDGDYNFHWNQTFGPQVLPREKKFNQDHFLAAIIPELPKEDSNSKRRVDKKELVVHMDNSICHNGFKI
jgi:hypothetical protein